MTMTHDTQITQAKLSSMLFAATIVTHQCSGAWQHPTHCKVQHCVLDRPGHAVQPNPCAMRINAHEIPGRRVLPHRRVHERGNHNTRLHTHTSTLPHTSRHPGHSSGGTPTSPRQCRPPIPEIPDSPTRQPATFRRPGPPPLRVTPGKQTDAAQRSEQ